jgi:hypothetical protein
MGLRRPYIGLQLMALVGGLTMGRSPVRSNLARDENGDLLSHYRDIFNRRNNYLC